jgi:LAS superfamily LD-carboxypeptidase LdcB
MSPRRSIWPWIAGAGVLALLGGGAAVYAVAYKNGQPIGKLKLVKVAGRLVSEPVAQAFLAMREAAKSVGVDLVLTSGFRTMEEQQRLWEAYQNGTGNLAAQPGYSNHQNGTAIDIKVWSSFQSPEYLWLAANAKRYGFVNTGKNFSQPEPWHWEYVG